MTSSVEETRTLAESVVRRSYGKLLAMIARRTRDIAGAEDALSDALATAFDRSRVLRVELVTCK